MRKVANGQSFSITLRGTPIADLISSKVISQTSAWMNRSFIFDESERGPNEELKLLFGGVKRLTPEEKHLVKELIEEMLQKHEARRWTAPASGG